MKNKKKILLILVLLIMLGTTGCTKYMQDTKGKKVINPKTGQNLTSNILCRPTDKDILDIYKDNEDVMSVKLSKLPECKNFKTKDLKYVSIWETVFVKPLAWLILKVGSLFGKYGLSIMFIGVLIRLILMPFTQKTMLQSENLKKAKPEIDRIEKKYADKTDSESMMAKSQETMVIYKKHNINPVSGCLVSFIQLPIFFAFLEAINRSPAIFEENLFGLQLGTTPLKGIGGGNYLYIILIALIILTTYYSFKNTMNTAPADSSAQGQMQFMTKFMLVFIAIASLSLPAAIGLYWITTSLFQIVQSIIIKRKKK